ncbi:MULTISPECIES: polysaccharide deacetylase family protein [Spirulina sp. CCY15215]|uniref:polysaccharide deacetylase family protein n=1 Tax=Spirulina sp. CCY15215 TaxID=2767591 RepID=UPI00194F00CA|nr:polysaccharide deacetylase family protein [Spirulina major]
MQKLFNLGNRAVRWFRKENTNAALILLYHRIAELPADPQLLSVSPSHFAEHLEVLRKYTHPLSLQQLVDALRSGNLPPRAVVITFDDGYSDNLTHAKPLLAQADIPATIFISTGYTEWKQEFWWDELERIFLQPNTLPQTLSLKVADRLHECDLGNVATYHQEEYDRDRSWNVLQATNPTPRHLIYRALHQQLFGLSGAEIAATLQKLQEKSGQGTIARLTHKPMIKEEIVQLAEEGLIEVGAHTMTHPVLANLPIAAQQEEIERSKTTLETILGHSVNSFSYPFGTPQVSYTSQTVELVREMGFNCAVTTSPELVEGSGDRYQLPRIGIRDCNGDEFAEQLQELLPVA